MNKSQTLSYRLTQSLLIQSVFTLEATVPQSNKQLVSKIFTVDPYLNLMEDIVAVYQKSPAIQKYFQAELNIVNHLTDKSNTTRTECEDSEKRDFFLRQIKVHKDLINYFKDHRLQKSRDYLWAYETIRDINIIIQNFEQKRNQQRQQDMEFGNYQEKQTTRSELEYQQMKTQIQNFLTEIQYRKKKKERSEEIIQIPVYNQISQTAPPTQIQSQLQPQLVQQNSLVPLENLQQKLKDFGNKVLGMIGIGKEDKEYPQYKEQEIHKGPLIIALNGLVFVEKNSIIDLPLAEIRNVLAPKMSERYFNSGQQKECFDPIITDIEFLKSYNMSDRKKFLLNIYGDNDLWKHLIYVTFPYERIELTHNLMGQYVDLEADIQKEERMIPKESIELFKFKRTVKKKVISSNWQKVRFVIQSFSRSKLKTHKKQNKKSEINFLF